jgi:hypothetical protein
VLKNFFEVIMMRCLYLTVTILILNASMIHANVAPVRPPIIIPPEPKASPVPLVIAGIAVTTGVVILGLWLRKKGRSTDSHDS